MNYRNYSQKTKFTAGSDALNLLPFYLTSINIPGINFNQPEVGGRQGRKIFLEADTITFNNLSFNILVDEDYKIYHEFMDIVFNSINVETGEFNNIEFDFWIEIANNKNNKLFKIEFYNCKLQSVGDLELDSQDEMTENNMTVDVVFDYYKIIKDTEVPQIIP